MDDLKVLSSYFADLPVSALYGILALRADVFVVEQDCVYLDPDGCDTYSWHVWSENRNGETVSCLRVIPPDGDGFAHIGRVVTRRDMRRRGAGRAVMEEGLRLSASLFPKAPVMLHAQTYAVGFYAGFGFAVTSGEFMEDGIPHVTMVRMPD